jgi:choline-sulfatase
VSNSRLVRAFFGIVLLTVVILIRPFPSLRGVRANCQVPVPARAPNLLILLGDDHAAWTLGIDGDRRQATPRLDALARQGVWFSRAYCNSPVCTPSRQSLITGRLPHAVGVTRLMTRLPDSALTLGDWLSDLGYETAAYGKMHFNDSSNHGFAERLDTRDWLEHLKAHPPEGGDHRRPWRPFRDPAAVWLNAARRSYGLPEESMETTYYADRAVEFLKRRHDRPFALIVSSYDPHSPYKFPREWEGRYRPEQFDAPQVSPSDRREQPRVFHALTPDDLRGIQAAYFTSLSFMDHQMGRVLDALDDSGHAADTLVVYASDNGYLLGQHGRVEKHCFYEQAVRIPLILRWAGQLPRGRRIGEMVEMVDVMPTLLTLLGLPVPPDLHGKDMTPLIRSKPGSSGRDVVFSEYLENEEAMVRSDRYKLIVGTGRRLRQDGYQTDHPLTGPSERLYDLKADPDETTDVADRPDLAGVKAELLRRLYERLVATRAGLEPIPPGLSQIEAIHWCLVPPDR